MTDDEYMTRSDAEALLRHERRERMRDDMQREFDQSRARYEEDERRYKEQTGKVPISDARIREGRAIDTAYIRRNMAIQKKYEGEL